MLLRSTFRKRPLSKLLTENCIMEEVRSPNGRAYTWEEQHFNLQICNLLNLLFFLFFLSIKPVFRHFSRRARCEIRSKLTIKTPEYVKLTIKLEIKTLLLSLWPLYR